MNTKLRKNWKKLRAIKKGWNDKCIEKEGESYRSGAFKNVFCLHYLLYVHM